ARQRLANAPLVQAFVVGGLGHQGEQARRIGQVGGHGPQRSLVKHAAALGLVEPQRRGQRGQLRLRAQWIVLGELRQSVRGDQAAARGLRDRKSTRLNSSHAKTSYAVFCQKQKNIALAVP